ncbi:MAG: hypothetical protein RLY31_662 [Bacteroidota bacterium]|jgi:hypothetical protein
MSTPRPSQVFQGRDCLEKETLLRYLAGTLDEAARWSAENHLLDCPLCAAAVAGISAAPASRDPLVFPPFQPPPARQAFFASTKPWWRRWMVAAILLLLLPGVLLLRMYRPADPLPEELFREYYTSYPCDIPLTHRGGTAAADPQESLSLWEGLSAYAAGDYGSASRRLDDFLATQPDHAAANFFHGLACLESDKAIASVPFLRVAASRPGLYHEKARWYLSLAYLRTGDLPAAAAMLDSLESAGDNFLSGKARALRAFL